MTVPHDHPALTGLGAGRCLLVGEVAMSHDGSLGLAHAFVDAIADAGADAVKFQTHIASAESTPVEPFRVPFSRQDASRYDYWKRIAFTEEQWRGLAQHCSERSVLFISSPFSLEAIELLERIGQPLWKIASGEVANVPLLDRVLDTGAPVLLSTGMSPLEETDAAVARVTARGSKVGVLQCTTAYPCPPERVGLNLIPIYRQRYGCWVGLSDHSGTIYPGLAGVATGLDVLEVHVALSREMFGPDVIASVTSSELKQLVDGVRFIEAMRANPLDKDASARDAEGLRRLFTRSIVARRALARGTVLAREHLALKKPGTGIPPEKLGDLVGKRLARPVAEDQLLSAEDIEDFAAS
jgi:N-acetylneuraminate synthase